MDQTKIDIEYLLEQGNAVQIKPQGYSMYPMFIPGRDEAVIQKADPTDLKRGDVILYRRDQGILVLHRIWKIKADGFYLVGDNQHEVEGPLRADQVKGVLVGFVRKNRYISVDQPIYRMASGLWLLFRPVRPILAKIASVLKRIFVRGGDK